MVISDLGVDKTQMKVELSFVTTTGGAQSATIHGQALMVMWSADSLDLPQLVHSIPIIIEHALNCLFSKSMHISVSVCCTVAGATVYSFAFFGPGTGPILLNNVQCSGTETRLVNCTNNGVGSHNCHHSEDASVRCQCKHNIIDTNCECNFLCLQGLNTCSSD